MLITEPGAKPVDAETAGIVFKFIFSWVVLMPMAVIISGKILGTSTLKMSRQSKQLFRVAIPRVLNLEARGEEVVFGFTAFFVTFLAITVPAGRPAYGFFVDQFGADPGQFNSLCILSSFTAVAISLVFVLAMKGLARARAGSDATLREHTRVIDDLARGRSGDEGEQ